MTERSITVVLRTKRPTTVLVVTLKDSSVNGGNREKKTDEQQT